MKVEQKGKGVVITLGKKETQLMEHAFNCAFSKSLERYCKEYDLNDEVMQEFSTKVWAKLNTIIENNDCYRR